MTKPSRLLPSSLQRILFPLTMLALLAIFPAACAWAATQETVLHSFRPSPAHRRTYARADGFDPFYGNLAIDSAGNLYGPTVAGGSFNYGTMFKLVHSGHGWVEGILFSFGLEGGSDPYGGATLDPAGNVYGTTQYGGDYGAGVAFELIPNTNGGWTKKVLHSFNTTDGFGPNTALAIDAAGNLYGTTFSGGAYQGGTAYMLSPNADGSWTQQVLHSFGDGTDGVEPYGPVVLDAAGNVYGTTEFGGTRPCGDEPGCGTVFKLSPTTGGGWTEQVIHRFAHDDTDGRNPFTGALIFDALGNLYGTTPTGGTHPCSGTGSEGCGAVYELTPASGGIWTEHILYSFNNNGDGYFPSSSLLFDAAGNLYGTTYGGGAFDAGAAFKLTPGSGGWTEQLLHSFGASGDGLVPGSGLVTDGAGNLYGTTMGGGTYGGGTVYEITP